MSATEAPSDRAQRSVSIVADALREPLAAAIDARGELQLLTAVERFAELTTHAGFPGDVVVLAEPAGPALVAHARTVAAAGAAVVVVVDADAALVDELDQMGAEVLPVASVDAAGERARVARTPRRTPRGTDRTERRPRLSPRERRALAYYVQGMTTVQVAQEMQISYETAKTFLRRVRAKYAAVERPAGKRSELIVRAEEDGIV